VDVRGVVGAAAVVWLVVLAVISWLGMTGQLS
jgi:hypothetical protein